MAENEKKGGVDFVRAIGFGLLGAFLVIVGYAGRGMTDEYQSYDSVPQHWLGPTFTGTVVAYNENENLTLKADDTDWICTIEDRTVITSTGDIKEITEGALVQVKFRGGKTPIAKNIRILERPNGAETPASTASPNGAGDTATPVSTASPTAAVPTPTTTP